MTKSRKSFDAGIKDAELMLDLYKAHPKESPESGEALKRAGLVLALTAWETYGDAVHRARVVESGTPPAPHTVKKDELDKAIRFLKGLVDVTERRFDR